MDEITVEIQKLVNGGQGLGFYDGKPVFVWNALPGETVTVEVTKRKKNFAEGIAVGIRDASPARIDPAEDHFMSCAPWQMMTFEHENRWKREIATETFRRMGGLELPDLAVTHGQDMFGYRNKIEYAICPDEAGKGIGFAFYRRGSHELVPIDKCLLAQENINRAAAEVLDALRWEKTAAGDLGGLLLRENGAGEVIASLFVTDPKLESALLGICGDVLTGVHVYLRQPQDDIPAPIELLRSQGNYFFTEQLAGKSFKCGPLSFFQVNLDVFEKTVARIGTFVGEEDEIVDFYSGVGAIGIALGGRVKSCVLIEGDPEAADLAGENVELNDVQGFTALKGSAESTLDEIKKHKTIIFDPPRAGLHPSVVDKVLEVLPGKIIYLSCDVATQARDLKMLSGSYEVKFCELYNFFPRTPHIESLVVLERE